jgi:cell division protein FtsZ
MGVGIAAGERRAQEAATRAINSPLLDISIAGAKGVLFSISGSEDLSMWEMQEAAKIIIESVDKDAKIISGTTIDNSLKPGEIKVTVIATGFPTPHRFQLGFDRKDTFGVIKNVESNNQPGNIRNFFGGNKQTIETVSKSEEKKIEIEPVVEEKEEVEDEDNTVVKKTSKLFNNKKEEAPKKEVEVVAEIDDADDWSSSIPSILRRNR